MFIEYIAIGIIVISIGVIVYIGFKKFPVLSSINIGSIQKHQQDKIKKGLLEDRLFRKFKSFNIKKIVGVKNENNNVSNGENNTTWFGRTYEKLRNMEKKYRDRIKMQLPKDKDEQKKNKSILLNEAKELAEKEEYKQAEEKLIELISLDSKFIEAYEGLADVYFEMKDYEHAKEIYNYLLKMNSQDDASFDHLGKIEAQKGNFTKAKDEFTKSISLNNTVASYHVDLGEIYMATAEYKRAMECFQEAIKLEPNNPKNLDALIKVAVKLHDFSLAAETFDKLKEVNPENEKLGEIKQEIDELKK
ncbi:MAG: tetratricopeptide repeat protein [bacterium]|nr:tetratricopeptide repeat protein [bacterium]